MKLKSTHFKRVALPDSCRRRGTQNLGGHCLMCGFDVSPYACLEVEEGIVVCRGGCDADYFNTPPALRQYKRGLPARHLSAFGDHGCRRYYAATIQSETTAL